MLLTFFDYRELKMEHITDWYTLNHSKNLIYEQSTLSHLSWFLQNTSSCLIALDNNGSKIAIFDNSTSRLKIFNGTGQLLKNQLWKKLVEIFYIDNYFVCVHEDHKIQIYSHDLDYLGKISNSEIDFRGIESAKMHSDGGTFVVKTKSEMYFRVNVAYFGVSEGDTSESSESSCIRPLCMLQKKTFVEYTGSGYFVDNSNNIFYIDSEEAVNLDFKFGFHFESAVSEQKDGEVQDPPNTTAPSSFEITKITDLHQFGLLALVVRSKALTTKSRQYNKLLIYNTDKHKLSKISEINLDQEDQENPDDTAKNILSEKFIENIYFIDQKAIFLTEKLVNSTLVTSVLDIYSSTGSNHDHRINLNKQSGLEPYKWLHVKQLDGGGNGLRIINETSHLYLGKVDDSLSCIAKDVENYKTLSSLSVSSILLQAYEQFNLAEKFKNSEDPSDHSIALEAAEIITNCLRYLKKDNLSVAIKNCLTQAIKENSNFNLRSTLLEAASFGLKIFRGLNVNQEDRNSEFSSLAKKLSNQFNKVVRICRLYPTFYERHSACLVRSNVEKMTDNFKDLGRMVGLALKFLSPKSLNEGESQELDYGLAVKLARYLKEFLPENTLRVRFFGEDRKIKLFFCVSCP